MTALVERQLAGLGADIDVVFCPERIAEGTRWMSCTPCRRSSAAGRPGTGARRGTVPPAHRGSSSSTPEEAELAKLFTNAWRYIKFATANQFYMIANDCGLDFDRICTAP